MSFASIFWSAGSLLVLVPVVSAHARGRTKLIALGCLLGTVMLLAGAGFAMARFMQTDLAQQPDWQAQEGSAALSEE